MINSCTELIFRYLFGVGLRAASVANHPDSVGEKFSLRRTAVLMTILSHCYNMVAWSKEAE
jgi:hypothetical protein